MSRCLKRPIFPKIVAFNIILDFCMNTDLIINPSTTMASYTTTAWKDFWIIHNFEFHLNIHHIELFHTSLFSLLKMAGYTTAGVEAILGVHGHGFWINVMDRFNRKVLRPCLGRNPEMFMDDSLLQKKRKIEYQSQISETNQVSNTGEVSDTKGSIKRPLLGGRAVNRSKSNDSVTPGISALFSAIDFATLIPDTTRVTAKGLHHTRYQLDELDDDQHSITLHHRGCVGYQHPVQNNEHKRNQYKQNTDCVNPIQEDINEECGNYICPQQRTVYKDIEEEHIAIENSNNDVTTENSDKNLQKLPRNNDYDSTENI